MDILSNLAEINWIVLISIVGIVEFIKNQDEKKKLKAFYGYFFLLLCIGFGFIENGEAHTWRDGLLNGFIYFGIGSLFYQFILRQIKGLIEAKKTEGVIK